MADDGMSASELRKRYQRGGSVADSDMSAAQLRSRYAIPSNTFKEKPQTRAQNVVLIVGVVVLILGAAAFFLTK